jgi:serine/threonine-protein phosphatase 2A activator
LPENVQGASKELIIYFYDSFGSNVRLDYGTGHELNFAQLLYCLALLGIIEEKEFEATVHHLFHKYICLMRKIQTIYWLEPAGSQGVWGLDDHHFLPFLFGAAELIDHPIIKLPSYVHKDELVEQYADDFMYLSIFR